MRARNDPDNDVPGKSAWGMNAVVAVLANKRLAMQAPARMLLPRPIILSLFLCRLFYAVKEGGGRSTTEDPGASEARKALHPRQRSSCECVGVERVGET